MQKNMSAWGGRRAVLASHIDSVVEAIDGKSSVCINTFNIFPSPPLMKKL
jgi:hypothetical protein